MAVERSAAVPSTPWRRLNAALVLAALAELLHILVPAFGFREAAEVALAFAAIMVAGWAVYMQGLVALRRF
jgi:hypothetical protein